MPAYVIFSDRSLIDMAAKRPATARLRSYADAFLDVVPPDFIFAFGMTRLSGRQASHERSRLRPR